MIFGIGGDEMGVRPGLPAFIEARSFMLNFCACFAEFAVCTHWQSRDAAAAIIGYEQTLVGFVQGQMARTGSPGCLLIQSRKLPFRFDAVSADDSAFFAVKGVNLANGV